MLYVSAVDSFMSNWGASERKQDVYVVACETPKLAKIAAANLRNRPEMSRVRTTPVPPRPSPYQNVSYAEEGHVYHTPGAIKPPVAYAEDC